MSDLKEEFKRRREERRRYRSNTWTNFFIRILALIFVILIIRHFGRRAQELKDTRVFSSPDTVEIQQGY
ncbi:MAG: hypothetical protein ISS80_00080 [Candidatus Cloacimonetes bacterium]|nr:hypothetical protein [Bacteroidota bacterium]MBL7148454.1 hypothetical protein [Candidatus Cloacimonadota bacterium]